MAEVRTQTYHLEKIIWPNTTHHLHQRLAYHYQHPIKAPLQCQCMHLNAALLPFQEANNSLPSLQRCLNVAPNLKAAVNTYTGFDYSNQS